MGVIRILYFASWISRYLQAKERERRWQKQQVQVRGKPTGHGTKGRYGAQLKEIVGISYGDNLWGYGISRRFDKPWTIMDH